MKISRLFFMTLLFIGQGADVALPQTSQAAERPIALRRERLSGRTLATITEGDFVHPSLSPNGRMLAYARVVRDKNMESTEVLLMDLASGKRWTLLSRKAARRYAVYQAFVTAIKWIGAIRVRASIADGDVGVTHLTFDTRQRRLVREEDEEPDGTERPPADHPQTGHVVPFQNDRLFLLPEGDAIHLYLKRKDALLQVIRLSVRGDSTLEVKHQSPERTIFFVRTYASYEKGNQPLFRFDGERLTQSTDYTQLYDVAIDRQGRRIAFCFWEGDNRHIVVKTLKK